VFLYFLNVYMLNKLSIAHSKISTAVYFQDKCFQLVMRVLTSFRTSDMDSAIKTLDQQKIDTLMKYIYRGFETPSEKTCSLLLAWHERVST